MLAREQEAGLIVVGSTDRGPVGRVLPAAPPSACCTARRARSRSPRAATSATPLQTIAVGFVDSPEGHAALAAAHALAAALAARACA